MVRVAQFSGPEPDKKGIFGKPGDQLQGPAWEEADLFGGEGDIIEYDGGSWDVIYRCTSAYKADRIAWTMERAARNKHVGYSQGGQRLTFWQELQAAGGDPAKILTDCNSDCSAGTAACVNNAGIPVNVNMTTRTEDRDLLGTGQFIRIDDPAIVHNPDYVRRGDIVWRQGHTAVIIDNGYCYKVRPCMISTGSVHQRVQSSALSRSLGYIPKGAELSAMVPASGNWIIAEYKGVIAWSSTKYLDSCSYLDIPVKITGTAVWIRKRPNVNADHLKLAHKGQIYVGTGAVYTDDRDVDWYEIWVDSQQGYVSSKYAKVVLE